MKSQIKKNFNRFCIILFLYAATLIPVYSQEYLDIPSDLKLEGVPKIRKAELQNALKLSSENYEMYIWDADSKTKQLIVSPANRALYLLKSPLATPEPLTDVKGLQAIEFGKNGTVFSYTKDNNGDDMQQLYLFNIADKSIKQLTSLTGENTVATYTWDEKGENIYYTVVDYKNSRSSLCKSDLQKSICYAVELKGYWFADKFKNNQVVLRNYASTVENGLYLYDLKSEKLTVIEDKEKNWNPFFVGDEVWWTNESKSCGEGQCILKLNLKNGNRGKLKLPDGLKAFSRLSVSPKNKYLLINENKAGESNLRIFQLNNGNITEELPQFIKNSVIWSSFWFSENEIMLTSETANQPAAIKSYNLETRQLTDWTKAQIDSQTSAKIQSAKLIQWKSFDNREISGFIYRPRNIKSKSPVLIDIHGGPQLQSRPFFLAANTSLVTDLGFSIIYPNVRGSSGFGGDFMDADNAEKRVDAVKDIEALLDWVSKQPDLDSQRVFLSGGSYGGFVALATATRKPKRIRGLIISMPIISIKNYLAQSWVDKTVYAEYGDPNNQNLMTSLEDLSALNHFQNLTMPILMVRGAKDSRVVEKDILDLVEQTKLNNKNVWFVTAENEGHNLTQQNNKDFIFAVQYKFLKTFK